MIGRAATCGGGSRGGRGAALGTADDDLEAFLLERRGERHGRLEVVGGIDDDAALDDLRGALALERGIDGIRSRARDDELVLASRFGGLGGRGRARAAASTVHPRDLDGKLLGAQRLGQGLGVLFLGERAHLNPVASAGDGRGGGHALGRRRGDGRLDRLRLGGRGLARRGRWRLRGSSR